MNSNEVVLKASIPSMHLLINYLSEAGERTLTRIKLRVSFSHGNDLFLLRRQTTMEAPLVLPVWVTNASLGDIPGHPAPPSTPARLNTRHDSAGHGGFWEFLSIASFAPPAAAASRWAPQARLSQATTRYVVMLLTRTLAACGSSFLARISESRFHWVVESVVNNRWYKSCLWK